LITVAQPWNRQKNNNNLNVRKYANVNKFKFCAIYSIGNLNNIKKIQQKNLKKKSIIKKTLKRMGLEFIRLSNK